MHTTIKKNRQKNTYLKVFCGIFVMMSLVFSSLPLSTNIVDAAPNQQMNYQGKLTTAANVAVADGTYNMRFWLLASSTVATTSAVWTESLTGTNKVTVTNGLFSIMLGSTSPLTSVDFNQTLYLGVEIGGSTTPTWDGEMSPRKILGTVPAAFEADKLDGLTSTQFVRTDATSTIATTSAATLLTVTQNGAGDIFNLFASTTEMFTVLSGGNVGIGTTSPSRKLTVQGGDIWLGGNFTATGTVNVSGLTTLSTFTANAGTTTNASSTNLFATTLGVGTGNYFTSLLGSGLINNSGVLTCAGATSTFGCISNADYTSFNSRVSSSSIDTSLELANLITDETGSGALVFANGPTFTNTPTFQNLFVSTTGTTTLGNASTTALTVANNAYLNTFTANSGTTTNASSTNLFSTNSVLTNATTTNIFASLARFTTSSSTNASSTGLTAQNAYLTNSTLTNATTTSLAIVGITGSTQCLRISTTGVVSGTGSDCGSGSIGGTGLDGYLARWSGASTLGTGLFRDNGTVAGVGATTSTSTFLVQGTGGVNPFSVASSTGANLFNILGNGNVGIGTTTPAQQLDITKSMNLTNTTNANQFGIIYKGNNRFLHDFNYGFNGAVTTLGNNLFFGTNAGNLTMGSGATSNLEASFNVGLGSSALLANTTGSYNMAIGSQALTANTTGYSNTGIGLNALFTNTVGFQNLGLGTSALYYNIGGDGNIGIGVNSLFNNSTGNYNVGIGLNAGEFQADGVTALTDPENSVYIGALARGFSNADSNSIVIGYGAIGLGANTVVLGSDSITTTALKGNVGIGSTTPSRLFTVGGDGFFQNNITAASSTVTFASSTSLTLSGTGYFTFASSTNASSTGLTAQNAFLTNATSTNLFSTLGRFTNASSTFASTTALTVYGPFYDRTASAGTNGMVLQTTGSGVQWVATSTLGLSGGSSNWTDNGTYLTPLTSTDGLSLSGSTTIQNLTSVMATSTNFLATTAFNVSAGGAYQYNGTNVIRASTTLNNYFFGSNSGSLTATGTSNLGFGTDALDALTQGVRNVAFGNNTLTTISTGIENTAIGDSAMGYFNDGAGSGNIAVGHNALVFGSGSRNVAVGTIALFDADGSDNIGIGSEAMRNASGNRNIAIGTEALVGTVSGNNNVGVGYSTMNRNISGQFNAAIGAEALYFNRSATNTIALGYQAGYGSDGNTASQNNVFLGYRSGYLNTTGNNNTLLGYQSGDNLTTGGNNIILGYDLDATSSTAMNSLNIGALIFGTGLDGSGTGISSGNIGIGSTTPSRKLTVAGDIFTTNSITAASSTITFASSTSLTLTGTGYFTFASSTNASSTGLTATNANLTNATTSSLFSTLGRFTNASSTFASTTALTVYGPFYDRTSSAGTNGMILQTNGSGVTWVATSTLGLGGGGSSNWTDNGTYLSTLGAGDGIIVAGSSTIGAGTGATGLTISGNSTTTLSSIAGIFSATNQSASSTFGEVNLAALNTTRDNWMYWGGTKFMNASSTGRNTSLGLQAGDSMTSGDRNTAFGYEALTSNTAGQYNVALGSSAMSNNQTGSFNVAIGLETMAIASGLDNIAIGAYAMQVSASGNNNIAIGRGALTFMTGVEDNIAIGRAAGGDSQSSSNNRSVSDSQMTFIGRSSSRDGNVVASTTILINGTAIGYNAKVGCSNCLALGGLGADAVKVGIGTSTPSSLLTVSNNISTAANTPLFTVASTTGGTSTSTLFTILASGNVGIGTTTPYASLTIAGSLGLTGAFYDRTASAGTNGMILQTNGSGATWVATSTLGLSGGSSNWTDNGTYLTPLTATDGLSISGSSTIQNLTSVMASSTNFLATTAFNVSAGGAYQYNGVSIARASTTLKNYFFGDAGNLTATNTDNTAVGYRSLNALTQGSNNTAIGSNALNGITTGSYNTAIGNSALSIATSSSFNISIGEASMAFSTAGNGNIAIGNSGTMANSTGGSNIAIGSGALRYTATTDSTAVGHGALASNTTGDINSAFGRNALNLNISGAYNTVFGGYALGSNLTGGENVVFGTFALQFNATSSKNTAIGAWAGNGTNGQTASANNVFLGYRSGYLNTTGNNNTLLGYQSGDALTTGGNNIILGYDLDATSSTAMNSLNIGALIFGTGLDGSGTGISSGNIGIGTSTPSQRLTVAGGLRLTGALFDSTNASGTLGMILQTTGTTTRWVATSTLGLGSNWIDNGTYLSPLVASEGIIVAGSSTIGNGTQNGGLTISGNATTTLFNIAGAFRASSSTATSTFGEVNLAALNTTRDNWMYWGGTRFMHASSSTFGSLSYGLNALASATTTLRNVAIGNNAMRYSTTSNDNVAVGMSVLQNDQGGANTAVGSLSMMNNISGYNNSAFGRDALSANVSGFSNTAIGSSALSSASGNNFNTAVGQGALQYVTNSGNAAFGSGAGVGGGTQDERSVGDLFTTFIGFQSSRFGGVASTTGLTNITAIGYDAKVGCNNCLALGGVGANAVKVGIGTSTPSSLLTVSNNISTAANTPLFTVASTTGGTSTSTLFTILANGSIGIGSTTPESTSLTIQRTGIASGQIAGIKEYLQFTNSASGTASFGDASYIVNAPTATSTLVGKIIRVEDSTSFGNVVRGLEVQAQRGTNTRGENTGLSGFGRTFGVRGTTEGDAGDTFVPAGVFAESKGTTQGQALRAYSGTITTSSLVQLFQDTSAFTGTGLLMNFGNSGGSFSSSSSKFIDLKNGGTTKFTVTAQGTTTIGDGTTNNIAGLQIGYGGLCVDNDGSCNASTTGRITSVSSASGNSDLAEMYFSSEDLKQGEIVALVGGLTVGRASEASAMPLLGVVSTKPGVVMGYDDTSLVAGEVAHPVALKGRVPVRLSDENGPILKGDRIALSSIPGVGMKATESGTTVGIALEDWSGETAYTPGYLNQFGDDLVKAKMQPRSVETDTRTQDGCSFGGGSAQGDKACVKDKVAKIKVETITVDNRSEVLAELASEDAETMTVDEGREVSVGQVLMFVDLDHHMIARETDFLKELFATSSVENGNGTETLWDRVKTLAQNFVDGVLKVAGIKTDELCVGSVCVDEAQFLQMVQSASAVQNGGGTPNDDEPVEEEPEGTDNGDIEGDEGNGGGSGEGDGGESTGGGTEGETPGEEGSGGEVTPEEPTPESEPIVEGGTGEEALVEEEVPSEEPVPESEIDSEPTV